MFILSRGGGAPRTAALVHAEVQTDEAVDEAAVGRLAALEARLCEAEQRGQLHEVAAQRLQAEKAELIERLEVGQLEARRLEAQLELSRLELEEKPKLGSKLQVSYSQKIYNFFW